MEGEALGPAPYTSFLATPLVQGHMVRLVRPTHLTTPGLIATVTVLSQGVTFCKYM